ncbi:hypothetical protein BZZ01_07850 [Nostocales cyanobacterium HT-58-2]|nr:hypothetical protein BZZ01_07850 [Nostocales cyanobacterium HT-58-2]
MNLPAILDIVLGLVFIYLILSLLASEIQELITTLFQWRAEHLKKSIEIMLAGNVRNGDKDGNIDRVVLLANRLYANPLIKNINQEAKGWASTLPRKVTWAVASLYHSLKTKSVGKESRSVFGDDRHTGPSYIPKDIFATTLLETLHLPELVQWLTESRIENFKKERLEEIKQIIKEMSQNDTTYETQKMSEEFKNLENEYETIVDTFRKNKFSLETSIKRMEESLDRFIVNAFPQDMQENEQYKKTRKKLENYKKDIFSNVEQAILLGGLQPNIDEVVQLVNKSSLVYRELKVAHEQLSDKDSENYKRFQKIKNFVENQLPDPIVENIEVLAKRAQGRIQTTEQGIKKLRQEIEIAFDSSMERASGVYKRNAKGVALLIGFILAVASNTDAFHMVDRLSKDSALRDIIVQNAGKIANSNNTTIEQIPNNTAANITSLTDEANKILTSVSLPIGWSDANLAQQLRWQSKPLIAKAPLDGSQVEPPVEYIKNYSVLNIMRMIPGWIVSGIAIAMGAPFWFDSLSKIMNVRNAGRRPESLRNQDGNQES